MDRCLYLAHEVRAEGARLPGEQQQRGGQQHGLHDEQQVVDDHSDQHQLPGALALLSAAASLPQSGARHVDAKEDHTDGCVGAPGHPSDNYTHTQVAHQAAATQYNTTHSSGRLFLQLCV